VTRCFETNFILLPVKTKTKANKKSGVKINILIHKAHILLYTEGWRCTVFISPSLYKRIRQKNTKCNDRISVPFPPTNFMRFLRRVTHVVSKHNSTSCRKWRKGIRTQFEASKLTILIHKAPIYFYTGRRINNPFSSTPLNRRILLSNKRTHYNDRLTQPLTPTYIKPRLGRVSHCVSKRTSRFCRKSRKRTPFEA
jgi:hypothetical protein